uniref:Head-to-tail stopper n=1 Tax=Pseudomonas phage Nican01 TaxID=3138540 RepID=A0AAU6W0P3_9CAUD
MCAMSAFIPTTIGFLKRAGDDFTVTGDRLYGSPVKVGLSVVRVTDAVQATSVRADTSASKSFADENVEQGRALVHPKTVPKVDDLLVIGGDSYEIMGVRPVYDMYGAIDHYQVELQTWV